MRETATAETLLGRSEPKFSRQTRAVPWREASAWGPKPSGWRHLYGGFYESGVSIEWHDFDNSDAFKWLRNFHPNSLELCLNLSGKAAVRYLDQTADLGAMTAVFYAPVRNALEAQRHSGQRHRFLTVEFSTHFLRTHLARSDGALHPLVEAFIQGNIRPVGLGAIHRLSTEHEQLVARLVHPPVFQGARSLWYQGKVLELMAEFFFERLGDEELFCDRQKWLARERVNQVVAILRQRFAEPPSLEQIGREVGCSPFYLSRTFSRETGMTIPQYLRKIRMERAAELLASGRYNVTEAAMEVGYSSLSHFSQAFCQTMGCCPALYPHAKPRPADSTLGQVRVEARDSAH